MGGGGEGKLHRLSRGSRGLDEARLRGPPTSTTWLRGERRKAGAESWVIQQTSFHPSTHQTSPRLKPNLFQGARRLVQGEHPVWQTVELGMMLVVSLG